MLALDRRALGTLGYKRQRQRYGPTFTIRRWGTRKSEEGAGRMPALRKTPPEKANCRSLVIRLHATMQANFLVMTARIGPGASPSSRFAALGVNRRYQNPQGPTQSPARNFLDRTNARARQACVGDLDWRVRPGLQREPARLFWAARKRAEKHEGWGTRKNKSRSLGPEIGPRDDNGLVAGDVPSEAKRRRRADCAC
jgi:hypothetical protein